MKSRPVVYLSAHGQDVTAVKALVCDALELRNITVVLKDTPARNKGECRKHYGPSLVNCDTVLQIVGLDAGPALPVDDSGEGPWSLGIWETTEARKLRKPVNRILLADDFPFVFAPRPKTPTTARLARKQDAYRRKLSGKGAGLRPVHDHEELIRQVLDLLALSQESKGEQMQAAEAAPVPEEGTTFASMVEGAVTRITDAVEDAVTLITDVFEKKPDSTLVDETLDADKTRADQPGEVMAAVESAAADKDATDKPSKATERKKTVIPEADLPVPLVDLPLPVPVRTAQVVVPRVVSKGRFKVRMKSELTRREPQQPQARIFVQDADSPRLPVPKLGQTVSPADLILPGQTIDEGSSGRMERQRKTGISQREDIPDFSFGVRHTMILVGASLAISLLLVGHAFWQHFHPAPPEADVTQLLTNRFNELSPAEPSDGQPQSTWPDRLPESAVTPEQAVISTGAPVQVPAVTVAQSAPVPAPVSPKPSLTFEQQQDQLEIELETAILAGRANGQTGEAYLQANARELRRLHRQFQRLKVQVVANFLPSHPNLFSLARDIAATHQLCLEFQAAENVLLDSREAALEIFGAKHAEVRLLDHLLAGNAVLKSKRQDMATTRNTTGAGTSGAEAKSLPGDAKAVSHQTVKTVFPMTPQDMEALRIELLKQPDLVPGNPDLIASGQP